MPDTPKKSKRSKHFIFSWRNAVYKSDLSSSEKFTLITISMFMTSKGFRAFPSIKLLAEKTSLSERSIKRAVKKANETGFISIAKKSDGKDWNHNQYTATFPKKDTEGSELPEGFLSPGEFKKKLEDCSYKDLLGYIKPEDLNKSVLKSKIIQYCEEEDPDQVPVIDAAVYTLEHLPFYCKAVKKYGADINDVWVIQILPGRTIYTGIQDIKKMIEHFESNGVGIDLGFDPGPEFFTGVPYTRLEKIPGRVWTAK